MAPLTSTEELGAILKQTAAAAKDLIYKMKPRRGDAPYVSAALMELIARDIEHEAEQMLATATRLRGHAAKARVWDDLHQQALSRMPFEPRWGYQTLLKDLLEAPEPDASMDASTSNESMDSAAQAA